MAIQLDKFVKNLVEQAAQSAGEWMASAIVSGLTGHGGVAYKGPAMQWHPQRKPAFGHPTTTPERYGGGSTLGPLRTAFGNQYRHGEPPYMRTGAGARSFKWEWYWRGDSLVFDFGVDKSARPGAPYMAFHEWGIKYPTVGPRKGTGPKLIRKWCYPTVKKYLPDFCKQLVSGLRG